MNDPTILWAAHAYRPRVAALQKQLACQYDGGYLSDEFLAKLETTLQVRPPAPPVASELEPREFIWQVNEPRGGGPGVIPELWYPGIQDYNQAASSSRTDSVKALVIHGTAGSSSAGAVSVIKAKKASFHWLVPDEDEPAHGVNIWACIPEIRAAWHVRNAASNPQIFSGQKNCNHWSLGVELVNAQNKRDPFSAWQIEVTAHLACYCIRKYPNLTYIMSHAAMDPARREDPTKLFPWGAFVERVQNLLQTDTANLARIYEPYAPDASIVQAPAGNQCCHDEQEDNA